MLVRPYVRPPGAPRVAWLTPEGVPVDEAGERLSWARWPASTRLYTSWDTAYRLVRAGHGEALCWNGEEIRWRHGPPADGDDEYGWRKQWSDAHVIRYPFDESQGAVIVAALGAWRDWLESFGAAPTGSTGSSAWSLLRARLLEPLWTRVGALPPLDFTSGGRIENGERGAGTYRGELEHLDLPAAYASTLGGLRYGGRWLEVTGDRSPAWWAASGAPVFVRARVRLPENLPFGLLLRRPSHAGYLAGLLESGYPRGGQITGTWTFEELELAERHGARVVVLGVWAHRARPSSTPFRSWWQAVEAGRLMGGLAGQLAKMTGNALHGRLAMDPRRRGERVVRSKGRRRLVHRRLPSRPAPPADHALAETVTGRVRAQLTEAMLAAGDELVCAHTDGLWLEGRFELEGWRNDRRADELELVLPMILRHRWRGGGWRTVFAGVPAGEAEAAFERTWDRLNRGEAAA